MERQKSLVYRPLDLVTPIYFVVSTGLSVGIVGIRWHVKLALYPSL